jgi:hypothetical protein
VFDQNANTALELAKAQRDLTLAKSAELREKFPRAMSAYDKGYLNLGDDTSDTATLAALAAKEQELLDMGVGVASPEPAEPEAPTGDVFGAARGAASPGQTQGPDTLARLVETMEAGKGRDIVPAIHAAIADGHRGWGAFSDLVEQYQAPAHPNSVM